MGEELVYWFARELDKQGQLLDVSLHELVTIEDSTQARLEVVSKLKAKSSHLFDYLSFEECSDKTMGFDLSRKASFKFVSKAVNSFGACSGLKIKEIPIEKKFAQLEEEYQNKISGLSALVEVADMK